MVGGKDNGLRIDVKHWGGETIKNSACSAGAAGLLRDGADQLIYLYIPTYAYICLFICRVRKGGETPRKGLLLMII